jgi:DNA invertase Pin-like site-specific DNA recombinase
MIQESIILDMQRNNVVLLSTLEADLCSADPTRILIRQILGAFAQYEKSQIVLKLQAARIRARAKSPSTYREGPKLYGSKDGELPLVMEIVEMRNTGFTLVEICDRLNGSGRLSRRGGRWFPMQIRRIVKRA